jgi:hypothetical protein
MVSKYKAKCIIGADAHSPLQIGDEAAEYAAVEFIKEHDLIVVDRLDTIIQH